MGAARSEDDVIRKILGLPKRHHLGTIPMYQWIHLVLADKLAYDGCRLNLVRLFGGLMKHFFTALFVLTIASQAYAQKTPYGSCPERAQAYQERYERSQRSQDLVCYQKALERELNGQNGYSCPNSSQHYQNAYERNQRSSDLVCFQKALERELQ